MNNPEVSIIVPAYNEEETICKVVAELLQIKDLIPAMEIIVVDDGSTDKTVSELSKFSTIKLIKHEHNMGKGAALKTGFNVAKGRVLLVQDADMEYSPHEIPNLIKPILDGKADVVYGSRFQSKPDGMSTTHFLGNIILSMTASILYKRKITDVMTGYKAFSSKVAKSIHLKENGFSVEVELTGQILQQGWSVPGNPNWICL